MWRQWVIDDEVQSLRFLEVRLRMMVGRMSARIWMMDGIVLVSGG